MYISHVMKEFSEVFPLRHTEENMRRRLALNGQENEVVDMYCRDNSGEYWHRVLVAPGVFHILDLDLCTEEAEKKYMEFGDVLKARWADNG